MHKLKELLHGHRSLKHGQHGHRWQGIVLLASAFIIILLLGENGHSQGGKKKCQVCIILFGTY